MEDSFEGYRVGRKHVATLMKRMGTEALYRKHRTTKPGAGHKIYPYLLRCSIGTPAGTYRGKCQSPWMSTSLPKHLYQ